jgi:hypothetical protein
MCALPENILVGQTPIKIVNSNDLRTGLFIRNLSENTISLGFDHLAELNHGITLFFKECYSMGNNDTSVADVYAVASGEGSLLAIQEYSSRSIE